MALEQFNNQEGVGSVRAKINGNFDKLSPRTGGTFTGVFDLSKEGPIKYPDYTTGAVVNLTIGVNPVPFSAGTIKIKGNLMGTVPNTWILNGDVISNDPTYTNVITVGYIDGTDIRLHNKVLIPADATAPTYIATYPKITNLGETTLSVEVQLNEIGTAYLVVVPDLTAAPTSQEVKDGTATGSIAARNVAVTTASTTATMNVTGLASGTAYDVYVVSEDSTGNLQASPTKLDTTTVASDVTAPTITSATIENASPTNLVVVHSEVVTIGALTGLSITGTGAPTINSVTGTGTNTLTYVLSAAAVGGEAWTLAVAGTNTVKDTATTPNSLAATTQAITNNVGAGITAEYQAVLNYWTANAIALPDAAQQTEDNQIMIDIKASGVWAKSDAVGYMAGNVSKVTAARLTDWKRLVQMTEAGTVTYGSFGAKGDGSTGYIDTGFIPATHGVNHTLNSAGVVFLSRELSTNQGAIFGVISSTDKNTQWTEDFNGTSYMNINGQAAGSTILRTRHLGYNGLYRTSATSVTLVDGSEKVQAFPSTSVATMPVHSIYLLGRNSNNTLGFPTNGSVAFFAIGGNMYAEHAATKTALE